MPTDPGFLRHILDLFAELGPLHTGRMFGGTSIYQDDAMFAVIFGDAIYMKSDPDLGVAYTDAGATPFVYDTKTGARTIHGLMSLPDSALDDPEEALAWARRSLVPAAKAARKRSAQKAKKSPSKST